MSKAASSPILRVIRRVVEDQHVKELSDHELLGRFVAQHDESAFHTLLRRHGAMVLDVCRCMLGNEADAEDAFQATFLVFARKAKTIRKATSLGSWLYGVSYRIALKAKAEFAKRKRHEGRVSERVAAESADDLTWREVREVLHGELTALPEGYRAPLVLCYLQGRTQDKAAAYLGLPKGTLKGRLERGRALLRERLVRRGLGTAGVLVASAWPAATQSAAAVRPVLMNSTVQAATAVAVGKAAAGLVSPKVVALTEGVVKAMFMTKLSVATVLVSGILFVVAAGKLGFHALAADQPAVPVATASQPATNAAPTKARREPADEKKQMPDDRVRIMAWYDVDRPAVQHLEFTPDGRPLVKHLEFSPDGTQRDRPVNEVDRFLYQQIRRRAYQAFFLHLQLDLLGTLVRPAEAKRFSEGNGKQRAAMINDMILQAAKEQKWDEKKQAQVRETILEMLLDLDQRAPQRLQQGQGIPETHPLKPIPFKLIEPKESKSKLSDSEMTALKVWLGMPLTDSDRNRIFSWYLRAQRDEPRQLSSEQRKLIEGWIRGR
jgi:RNA polymerase sigma factor (sigma-70 family)